MYGSEFFRPLEEGTFAFACRPGLSCFTECCRDLNLVLTPYDVLRLKNRLRLSSMDFLDRYTVIVPKEHNGLPAVRLKMEDNERRTCPFVTAKGCQIYEDRPGACRIYPIGRASSKTQGQERPREFFFTVREDHCRGFEESKEWTVEAWCQDQGLEPYQQLNDLWMEIVTRKGSLGPREVVEKKHHMFFMASYNLDQFRRFVLETRFLSLFDLPETRIEKIKTDDLELQKLALEWLKFSLYGEKTLPLKEPHV